MKGGLGSGGALASQEPQRLDPVAQLLGIQRKILGPERGALAYRGELGRLKMGVREAGKGGALPGEAGENVQQCDQPPEQETKAVPHHDEIGVVGHERAGGTEMDEPARGGRQVSEGVDVRHDVVPEAPLVLSRRRQVDVVKVGPELLDGFGRNVQAELPLGFHQREPEPAPQSDPVGFAPEVLHGRGRVPGAKWGLVRRTGQRNTRSVKIICPLRSK